MSDGKRTLPVVQYLTEVRQELLRVSWPTRQQTLQKTGIVIGVSIAVGLYIGVLDFVFTRLMTVLIGS
jgi:preprotein translocase subunit SecE